MTVFNKKLALIILLAAFLFKFFILDVSLVYAQSNPFPTILRNTIVSIKDILRGGFSKDEVIQKIFQVRSLGGRNYKSVNFKNGGTGWILESDVGHVIQTVNISFYDGMADEAWYFGPKVEANNVDWMHNIHRQFLSKNYQEIDVNEYSLGQDCWGTLSLVRSSSGGSRSKIHVVCY